MPASTTAATTETLKGQRRPSLAHLDIGGNNIRAVGAGRLGRCRGSAPCGSFCFGR